MPYKSIDLSRVRTYPLPRRASRVALENLITPATPLPEFNHPELPAVVERIVAARKSGRPVVWMIGAHVVKRGLSPILIALMEQGIITHLASNGATIIHDFEIALQGQTSEDVAKSIEDGSFGMAEETGRELNLAIRSGARQGLGIGEAVGAWMDQDPRFAHREMSLVHTAYRLNIPYTVHVAVGTDIIHQHPLADFAAIGWGSGQDFKIFCASVCDLEGGVFCNFGSAVIGPEVFLKALSIARNLGNPLRVFTTANFDLFPMQDYRRPIGDENPEYYYRPRKNIVNRPVSLGGHGYHILGDHLSTIPNLYHQVMEQLGDSDVTLPTQRAGEQPSSGLETESPDAAQALAKTLARFSLSGEPAQALAATLRAARQSLRAGGTLFVSGDPVLVGQVVAAHASTQALPAAQRQRLLQQPGGEELVGCLRPGLRLLSLDGLSGPGDPQVTAQAQGFYALSRPGDVLLVIEQGQAPAAVLHAAATASALGCPVLSINAAADPALAGLSTLSVRLEQPGTDGRNLALLCAVWLDILKKLVLE